MCVQSVVNLSPSFSEERPERKSERERELLRFKSETLSLTPRVFACSSFAFPTAFNKLFLIEWFRVLNPNEQGNSDLFFFFRLFLSTVRARKTSSNHRVLHLTATFSRKRREREMKIHLKTLCVLERLFNSSLLLFFSRKSLSFLLRCFEAVFSNPDLVFSLSFLLSCERAMLTVSTLFSLSLSLSLCVCVFFSLSDA